jgi:hypothetical protein
MDTLGVVFTLCVVCTLGVIYALREYMLSGNVCSLRAKALGHLQQWRLSSHNDPAGVHCHR